MKIDEMNLAELKAIEKQLQDEVKGLETELHKQEEAELMNEIQERIADLSQYKEALEAELERYRR